MDRVKQVDQIILYADLLVVNLAGLMMPYPGIFPKTHSFLQIAVTVLIGHQSSMMGLQPSFLQSVMVQYTGSAIPDI